MSSSKPQAGCGSNPSPCPNQSTFTAILIGGSVKARREFGAQLKGELCGYYTGVCDMRKLQTSDFFLTLIPNARRDYSADFIIDINTGVDAASAQVHDAIGY